MISLQLPFIIFLIQHPREEGTVQISSSFPWKSHIGLMTFYCNTMIPTNIPQRAKVLSPHFCDQLPTVNFNWSWKTEDLSKLKRHHWVFKWKHLNNSSWRYFLYQSLSFTLKKAWNIKLVFKEPYKIKRKAKEVRYISI